MKRLAIIIVTYNSERDIFDCVKSIMQYNDLSHDELELIVVDNCSREPEPMFSRLREQWGEDIICIENDTNAGYGQGNNVGLRHASAPVALIMNPDVRLLKPIFRKALDRYCRQTSLAVLGLKQYSATGQLCHNSIACDWLTNGYVHTLISALFVRMDWFLPSCMWVQGSCFFIQIEKFKEIGMFDETHFMYGEEEDIHYRLVNRFGNECYAYDPSLIYQHLNAEPAPSFAYERRLVDANVELYKKKGIDPRCILRNYKMNVFLLLCRIRLRSKDFDRRMVLRQLMNYIRQQELMY